MKYTSKVNVNSNQRQNLKYFVFVLFVIPRSQALFSYKDLLGLIKALKLYMYHASLPLSL